MALFFDAAWFDARLAERGLDRAALAAAAGLGAEDLALVFKDQREVAPAEVRAFAALLGAALDETASRCGVSTRVSTPGEDAGARLDDLESRLDRVERWIAAFEAERGKPAD